MANLYSNENFPLRVVEALRHLGHDVLTVQETGHANRGTSDEAVLGFARERNRVVLTLNRRHFKRLHGEQPDHPGIIVCSFDSDFDALAQRIHTAISAAPDLRGTLLRVNRPPA